MKKVMEKWDGRKQVLAEYILMCCSHSTAEIAKIFPSAQIVVS